MAKGVLAFMPLCVMAVGPQCRSNERYLDMDEDDVANAFGTSQIDTRIDTQKKETHHK